MRLISVGIPTLFTHNQRRSTPTCRTAAPTASGSRSPTSRGSARPRSPGSSPAQPFHSLADFWNRAHVSRPVTERLVLAGGFDTIYGIDTVGAAVDPGRPRHRGLRAAHAPEGGRRGARGYGSADDTDRTNSDVGDVGMPGNGPNGARSEARDGAHAEAGDSGMRDVELDAKGSGMRNAELDAKGSGMRDAESGDGAGPHYGPLTTLTSAGLGRRGRVTRRDLLLHVAELDRWSRATAVAGKRVRTGTTASPASAWAPSAARGSGPASATYAGTRLVRRRRADRDRRTRLGVGRQGAEPAGQPRPARSPVTVDRSTSGRERIGRHRGGS